MLDSGLGSSLVGFGARKARCMCQIKAYLVLLQTAIRTGGHRNGRSNLCTYVSDGRVVAMYEIGAVQFPALLNHGSYQESGR
jgi:hypothetical protein